MISINVDGGPVNSKYGLSRIITYIIPGKSGQVEVNGGAANFFRKGEKIHVNCFAIANSGDRREPLIVKTDDMNKIQTAE